MLEQNWASLLVRAMLTPHLAPPRPHSLFSPISLRLAGIIISHKPRAHAPAQRLPPSLLQPLHYFCFISSAFYPYHNSFNRRRSHRISLLKLPPSTSLLVTPSNSPQKPPPRRSLFLYYIANFLCEYPDHVYRASVVLPVDTRGLCPFLAKAALFSDYRSRRDLLRLKYRTPSFSISRPRPHQSSISRRLSALLLIERPHVIQGTVQIFW